MTFPCDSVTACRSDTTLHTHKPLPHFPDEHFYCAHPALSVTAIRRCVQEGSGSYALSEPPIANTTIARFVVIGGARRRWPNETFPVLAALWHSRVLVCAVHSRAR